MDMYLVFIVLFGITLASEEHESEPIIVTKLSGDVTRGKRSTEYTFPPEMVFQLEMQGGGVKLNLERTVEHGTAIPLYVLEGDMNIRLHSNRKKKKYGVYQDQARGASVIVKCPDDNQYHLFGAFVHKNNQYQIEPVTTEPSSGKIGKTHRVRRQTMPYGDFHGDELIAPAEGTGLNRPESPPFPGNQVNTADLMDPPIIPLQMEKIEDGLTMTTTEEYESDVLLPEGRRRRQTEPLYIEYMVVIDYKNLERWKSKVGGATVKEQEDNAFDAMHEFYMFVVNGIDVRFRTATVDGPEIRVLLATLLVSMEEATSPWIQNNKLSANTVDDAGVLLDFATWKNSVIQYLPQHDHAGLFTGFDIATPTSLNPIGMGYLNSICHNSWAVSEIEETYNAVSIHIAAHELGHNIGTRHDGNGNSCPSSSLYLMAPRLPIISQPSIKNNPWTFSTCSQSAIKTFVDGLGSSSCLTNIPGSSSLSEKMPGLFYSADQQCNMTFGNDAVLCRDNLYYQWESICYAMQCKKMGPNSCSDQLFPFDGTPCGNNKWCQSGSCVYSDDALALEESCLFGDDPNVDCSGDDVCDENNFYSSKVRCCGTCIARSQTTSTSSSKSSSISTVTSTTETTSTLSTTKSSPSSSQSSPSSSVKSSTSSSSPLSSSSISTLSSPSSQSSSASSSSSASTVSSSMSSTTRITSPTESSSTPSTTSTMTTMTTSTTSLGTSQTTTSFPQTTKDTFSELSFDLQTMITLFISSAVII